MANKKNSQSNNDKGSEQEQQLNKSHPTFKQSIRHYIYEKSQSPSRFPFSFIALLIIGLLISVAGYQERNRDAYEYIKADFSEEFSKFEELRLTVLNQQNKFENQQNEFKKQKKQYLTNLTKQQFQFEEQKQLYITELSEQKYDLIKQKEEILILQKELETAAKKRLEEAKQEADKTLEKILGDQKERKKQLEERRKKKEQDSEKLDMVARQLVELETKSEKYLINFQTLNGQLTEQSSRIEELVRESHDIYQRLNSLGKKLGEKSIPSTEKPNLDTLIIKIDKAILTNRLSLPVGKSAKDLINNGRLHYPNNNVWDEKKLAVIERYVTLAKAAIGNKNKGRAASMIDKIKTLDSTNPHIITLNNKLQDLIKITQTIPEEKLLIIEKQIKAGRLSKPKDDNASEALKQLDLLYPNHAKLKALWIMMAEGYTEKAQEMINEKKISNAQIYLDKALKIDPYNQSAKLLQKNLVSDITVTKTSKLIVSKSPLEQQTLKELLALSDRQIKAWHLYYPQKSNAIKTLNIAKKNYGDLEEIQNRIDTIASRYLGASRRALKNEDFEKSWESLQHSLKTRPEGVDGSFELIQSLLSQDTTENRNSIDGLLKLAQESLNKGLITKPFLFSMKAYLAPVRVLEPENEKLAVYEGGAITRYVKLVQYWVNDKKNYERAIGYIKSGLEAYPNNSDLLDLLGRVEKAAKEQSALNGDN
ncbi:MAG: hypothetical protein HQL71_00330 [Magnetococcales bacterium]|nr:hypothetical protein [Magnetococcales bacterium]